MTQDQPSRLNRIEARLDNLVTIVERLAGAAEVQQENIERLAQLQARSFERIVQIQEQSFQRMEQMLERFLRQSGNGHG